MLDLDQKINRLDWKIDESLIPSVQEILNEVERGESIEFQTSGSTGKPKKISFTQEQVIRSSERTAKAFQLHEKSSVFCALPAKYVAGKMMLLRSLFQNWQLHWQQPSSIPQVKANYDFGVFTVAQVVAMLEANGQALDNIQTILLGGGALTAHAEALLQQSKTRAFIGYGMTETLTHVALMEIGVDTHYKILPDVQIQRDEAGCLRIHDVLLQSDWLQTNDVVEDKEGGFLVLGRRDFVINTGGVKVFPELLEARLASYISSAFFVVGSPDDVLGEHITVVIEGGENTELRSELLNLNWGVEKPREIVFKEELERTESGKLKRTR